MSRSYRHTPIIGITTARSEKQDKRLANRRERTAVRQAMHVAVIADDDALDALVLPHKREVSNVWSFAKDGKQRMTPESYNYVKYMRK